MGFCPIEVKGPPNREILHQGRKTEISLPHECGVPLWRRNAAFMRQKSVQKKFVLRALFTGSRAVYCTYKAPCSSRVITPMNG